MIVRLVHHHAGTPAEMRAYALCKVRMRIDAGPHRRAAQRQLGQFFGGPPDAFDRPFSLARVAKEFLAQSDRRRILKVGAPRLDDGHELLRLELESLLEEAERRYQLLVDGDQRRKLHRRRNHVVARLTSIDMVVRMHRLPRAEMMAEDLVGAVGDDLIRVGVRGGSRAGLENIDHEIPVEFPFLDFLGGLLDRAGQTCLQEAEFSIHQGGRAFDLGQGADKATRHSQIADRKVLPGPLGACTVIGDLWNPHLAHGVSLHSRALLRHARSS